MAPIPLLGETLSLSSALAWAAAVILFKKLGEHVSAPALNLFKNGVAAVLLFLTIPLMGLAFIPHRPPLDWVLLALSGVLGISVADTLFLAALNRLGAGLVAVVDTLYSPAVIVLSYALLGERPGWQVLVGGLFIIGAILVGAAGPPDAGKTRRQIIEGVILGCLGVVLMGVGIVMVQNLLATESVVWVSGVRVFFGTIGLLPLLFIRDRRAEIVRLPRSRAVWRLGFPAAFVGAYLAMIAWIGGFKFTQASVAAILNQTTTVFIFLFAALFLREPLNLKRSLAVAMAMAGAVIVVLR